MDWEPPDLSSDGLPLAGVRRALFGGDAVVVRPPLSPGGMAAFLACPRRYWGQYVSGELGVGSPEALGRWTRAVARVADMAARRTPREPLDPGLDAAFLERAMRGVLAMGGEILADLPLAVDEGWRPCAPDDPRCRLRTRAALAVRPRVPGAPLLLVDVKTGRSRARWDFRMRVRAMLAHAVLGADVVEYACWFLAAGEESRGRMDFRGRAATDDVAYAVEAMNRCFRTGRFPPSKGPHCRRCRFRTTGPCL